MLSSHATNGTSVEEYDQQIEHTKLGFARPTLFVNYSLLPEVSGTENTKQFFESILVNGVIGRNADFQDSIDKLTIAQIVSNMLLKPNVQQHLETVGLSTNMLTMDQIKACYMLSHALLADLNKIASKGPFNYDQTAVLNTAIGRLTFLRNSFKQELLRYEEFDPQELKKLEGTVAELLHNDQNYQLVSREEFERRFKEFIRVD